MQTVNQNNVRTFQENGVQNKVYSFEYNGRPDKKIGKWQFMYYYLN